MLFWVLVSIRTLPVSSLILTAEDTLALSVLLTDLPLGTNLATLISYCVSPGEAATSATANRVETDRMTRRMKELLLEMAAPALDRLVHSTKIVIWRSE